MENFYKEACPPPPNQLLHLPYLPKPITMALQTPISFNTFTLEPLEEKKFDWGGLDMFEDGFTSDGEMPPVLEHFVESIQPSQKSVDVITLSIAEVGGQEGYLQPTVGRDPQVIPGDIVLEPFQVEDGEEPQDPAEDAVEVSPQANDDEGIQDPAEDAVEVSSQANDDEEIQDLPGDATLEYIQVKGTEPQNPEIDTSPEPIQTDDKICSPQQRTPEPIQLKNVKESHDPGSDALESIQVEDGGKPQDPAERRNDSGAEERCQSKV
jgi:hypothetical protein